MANFPTHWRFGLAVSAVGGMGLHWLSFTTARELPILIIVGVIASIIPDMDSDTSRPLRIIFNGLAFVLPPILIWRIPWIYASGERVLLFWCFSIFFILKPAKWFFKKCTVHRGVIHSTPAALTFTCLAFILAHHEAPRRTLQLAIAIIAGLGYFTHLILDEIWAVDFNGKTLKVKRSFGTALSLTGSHWFHTFITYLGLVISIYYSWVLWNGLEVLPVEYHDLLLDLF
jgi:hypothetical protein